MSKIDIKTCKCQNSLCTRDPKNNPQYDTVLFSASIVGVAIDSESYSLDNLKQLYLTMVKIREVEEKISAVYKLQGMRTPTHLGIGQEAVAAGVLSCKKDGDVIFSHHRCHNHYLAAGGSVKGLFSELMGKVSGCSGGKGGSVHLVDRKVGFFGSSPILGQSVALATGSAFAMKFRKTNYLSFAFFGDAALEEGITWESFNFASLNNLPVLYICENNGYSTESSISKRVAPYSEFLTRVSSFGVDCETVDGNDVIEIQQATKKAINRIKEVSRPVFLECRTYRLKEHVGPENDWDLNRTYRSKFEVQRWIAKCPIARLEEFLISAGLLSKTEASDIKFKCKTEIDIEYDKALDEPFPLATSLNTNVFVEMQ